MDCIKQLNSVTHAADHDRAPLKHTESVPNKMCWGLSHIHLFGMPVIYPCIPALMPRLSDHNSYLLYQGNVIK